MSSTLQSSNDDSSTESVESFENEVSNTSGKGTIQGSTETIPRSTPQTPMALARLSGMHPQFPNIQPHQHSTLFYLSLIEGRCRSQAAAALNEGRSLEESLPESHPDVQALAQHLFKEMCDQLHKAGVLPDEFAGQELSEVRKSYLSSFDTILHNIATQKRHDFQDNNTYSSLFDRSNAYAIGRDFVSNSLTNARTLALQKYQMAPDARQLLPDFPSLSLKDTFVYKNEYKEICLLGKGGFGKVYKVHHHLDRRDYAIKKVVMKGDTFYDRSAKDKVEDFLSELRALARLNHVNIVRYHHSWAETQATRLPGDSSSSESGGDEDEEQFDIEDPSKIGSKVGASSSASLFFRNITNDELALKSHLLKEARHVHCVSQLTNLPDDSVLFEQSARSDEKALVGPKRSSFFRTVGDDESDDGTEEISLNDHIEQNPLSGLDIVIFIKMALHPMNLEDYLWSEQQRSEGFQIEHCYHTIPTARVLLGVLDGVEYIHRHDIAHRDLKPSNIMLSVSRDPASSLDGYTKVSDCNECSRNRKREANDLYIIPHIGDFGLVANIGGTQSEPSPLLKPSTALASKTDNRSFLPPALSGLSSQQPGTRFYSAPKPLKGKAVICPKVDVYSLGVIALEMIYRFGTKSERAFELDKLTKDGIFPQGFENHEMAEGINHMLSKERNDRWECEEVRRWLTGFVEKAQE